MCITSNLSWSQHIVLMLLLRLNMLHQHLFGCSLESKCRAFSALVLPILENACTVWNPHTQQNIKLLQAVQTCGARWVCSARYDPLIFHWSPPSSQCCINLHWPSLQVRHKFLTILNLTIQTFNYTVMRYHLPSPVCSLIDPRIWDPCVSTIVDAALEI